MILTADDLPLKPSAYHLRVDVLDDNQALLTADDTCGSVAFYVAKPRESAASILGSFYMASVASFALDRHSGLVAYTWEGPLPPTGDPLASGWRAGKAAGFFGEGMEGIGTAVLMAAQVFAATGETQRATVAEGLLEHLLNDTFAVIDEHGVVFDVTFDPTTGRRSKQVLYPPEEQGWCWKWLAQCAVHYHIAGRTEFAAEIAKRMEVLADFTFAQPVLQIVGCGSCANIQIGNCHKCLPSWSPSQGLPPSTKSSCPDFHKVYDGRVLAGFAFHLLACANMSSSNVCTASAAVTSARVSATVEFGTAVAQHMIAMRGWYADHDNSEGGCYGGYGTENAIIGLIPTMLLATSAGNSSATSTIRQAVVAGVEFLVRTGGAVMSDGGFNQTGMLWYPERDSHWARGTTLLNLIDAYQASIDSGNASLAYWYKGRMPMEGFDTAWPADLCHSNFIGLLLRQAAEKEGIVWQPSVL